MKEQNSLETELALLKKDMEIIQKYLQEIAGMTEAVKLLSEEVKGNKDFKKNFDENVMKIVTNYIQNQKNLKALESISDKQINTFINSNEFTEIINRICEAKTKIDLNDHKSDTYSSVKEIISQWSMKRERVVTFKLLGWVFGSLSTLIVIYQMVVGR